MESMNEKCEQVLGVKGSVAPLGDQGERARTEAHLSFQAGCMCHLPNPPLLLCPGPEAQQKFLGFSLHSTWPLKGKDGLHSSP